MRPGAQDRRGWETARSIWTAAARACGMWQVPRGCGRDCDCDCDCGCGAKVPTLTAARLGECGNRARGTAAHGHHTTRVQYAHTAPLAVGYGGGGVQHLPRRERPGLTHTRPHDAALPQD